jgi:hypothetical protein
MSNEKQKSAAPELSGIIQAGRNVPKTSSTDENPAGLAGVATASYTVKSGEPAEPLDFTSLYGEHGGQVLRARAD